MTTDPAIQDPLVALRRAIAAGSLPTPTTDPDPTVQDPSRATDDLSAATHLFFREPAPQTVPLTAATRFVSSSSDSAVDLRSIFFAWQKKDVAIPEYIASATELNEALKEKPPQPPAGEEGAQSPVQVQNLVFVERLDLITWLEGASDDSEYIKPLEGAAAAAVAAAAAAEAAADAASAQAQASANIASGAAGGVSAVTGAAAGAGAPPAAVQAPAGAGAGAGGAGRAAAKTIDPRLQEIYNGERKMGDRNSVLRGIKPTDFSHVRKTAEAFLGRNRTRPGQGATSSNSNSNAKQVSGGKTPLVPNPSSGLPMPKKHGSGHSNPIILLSPSASSLIRMTNVKSFLQDGVFVPPDHPTLSMSTSPNILEIQRPVGGGSSVSGPGAAAAAAASQSTSNSSDRLRRRFTLVDSTANFRPEYWSRLVAVFTTGQTWQFKSYKWSSPPELFKHASGIYVGWRGEDPPREVKGWGRGVEKFAVERWDERGGGVHGAGRWMDREVVEGIWRVIEDGMKIRGWAR